MALFKREWIRVKVTGRALRLVAGKVKLNKKQAEDRSNSVKQVSGTVYEIVQPIEFKRGETLEMNREVLTKVALASVEPVDAAEPQETKTSPATKSADAPETPDDEPLNSIDPTAEGLLKKE